MLWFIQHYLWDLSNAPDIRRHEVEAFEWGYNVVNEDLADAVRGADRRRRRPGRDGPRLPPVHAAGARAQSAPGRVPPPLRPHPVDPAGRVARAADPHPRRALRGPAGQRHHRLPHPLVPLELPAVLPRPARGLRGRLRRAGSCARPTAARCGSAHYPLPIDWNATRNVASSPRVSEFEGQLLRRRRDHLILRVDRADLSKNVLRGFSAFDLFLEQHPEFSERVTFMAQLMPSRTDVPEYAEYLERIEALVAVVNHRHGTPDWMPIHLKLRDDLEEAMASYKHYDVLMVNAMFDGMNLVAKEGPVVNERNGVSILSENTGAHEELGEFALSREPVRHPGDRRLDPRGADDGRRGARAARRRACGRSSRSAIRATGSTAARGHPQEAGLSQKPNSPLLPPDGGRGAGAGAGRTGWSGHRGRCRGRDRRWVAWSRLGALARRRFSALRRGAGRRSGVRSARFGFALGACRRRAAPVPGRAPGPRPPVRRRSGAARARPRAAAATRR